LGFLRHPNLRANSRRTNTLRYSAPRRLGNRPPRGQSSGWVQLSGKVKMLEFKQSIDVVGNLIDGTGVLLIVIGLLAAGFRFIVRGARGAEDAYRGLRRDVGKAILLGLEFLVAGDIIRTVAVDPTLQNALVLGVIVLIRTFLSISLQVELEGRWPWQR
jgi:uncharacterized membrane protein